jgi:hypothetical protein
LVIPPRVFPGAMQSAAPKIHHQIDPAVNARLMTMT